MKKVEAIIKPFRLEQVRDALGDLGIESMTVSEVRGFGHDSGPAEQYRGRDYVSAMVPRLKIEVVVPDQSLDATTAAILQSVRTGKPGDGKLFITPVEQAVRIRTQETSDSAL